MTTLREMLELDGAEGTVWVLSDMTQNPTNPTFATVTMDAGTPGECEAFLCWRIKEQALLWLQLHPEAQVEGLTLQPILFAALWAMSIQAVADGAYPPAAAAFVLGSHDGNVEDLTFAQ